MLSRWKVRVVTASNVELAMQCLNTQNERDPIKVTIIDMQMPHMDGAQLVSRIRERPDLSQHVIGLLLATKQREGEQQCSELGVRSYVVKPVRAADMQHALLLAIHNREASTVTLTRSVQQSPRSTTLNLLLAEDNVVNQKLMVRLLERRGHRVTVAGTGLAALECMDHERFDLVFMDVQMPELDGLAAAQEIRRREQATGRHTPIVALTAHAMTGDRERCLAVGMDGYLTKPVDLKELHETLDMYIQPRAWQATASGYSR